MRETRHRILANEIAPILPRDKNAVIDGTASPELDGFNRQLERTIARG